MALLRRARQTGCAAQHAGAKRQPATDIAIVDPLMDECEIEQARLFWYFISCGELKFPKVRISMKPNMASRGLCDG